MKNQLLQRHALYGALFPHLLPVYIHLLFSSYLISKWSSNMAYVVTSMYYYIMINILDPLCFSGLEVLDCCRMLRSVLLSYELQCFLTILVDEHMIIVMKCHHYKTFTTMTLILLFLYLRHCVQTLEQIYQDICFLSSGQINLFFELFPQREICLLAGCSIQMSTTGTAAR